MRYAVHLYTTEKIKKKLPYVLLKLSRNKPPGGVWLVTLASNEKNLLDIFHEISVIWPMFRKMDPDIVGIAESEETAKELTVKILQDVYEKQGNFNVREYFEFQE